MGPVPMLPTVDVLVATISSPAHISQYMSHVHNMFHWINAIQMLCIEKQCIASAT